MAEALLKWLREEKDSYEAEHRKSNSQGRSPLPLGGIDLRCGDALLGVSLAAPHVREEYGSIMDVSTPEHLKAFRQLTPRTHFKGEFRSHPTSFMPCINQTPHLSATPQKVTNAACLVSPCDSARSIRSLTLFLPLGEEHFPGADADAERRPCLFPRFGGLVSPSRFHLRWGPLAEGLLLCMGVLDGKEGSGEWGAPLIHPLGVE